MENAKANQKKQKFVDAINTKFKKEGVVYDDGSGPASIDKAGWVVINGPQTGDCRKRFFLEFLRGDHWFDFDGPVRISRFRLDKKDDSLWGSMQCYNWIREKYGDKVKFEGVDEYERGW